MVMNRLAGVVGLQKSSTGNDLAESATAGQPAKTAGNPSECRTSLREKLRLIRDSDHPARWWASVAVQILDECVKYPQGEQAHAKAMRRNGTLLAVGMTGEIPNKPADIPLDELAKCLGLGNHARDLQ